MSPNVSRRVIGLAGLTRAAPRATRDVPSVDEVPAAIARARAAQAEIEHWDQAKIDALVAAVGWQAYRSEQVALLADAVFHETGMGARDHLFAVQRKRVLGTLRDLHGARTVGIVEELPRLGIVKIAKPVGVIAVASPATAPASGIACNALQMLKTRNAAIFSPHPQAQLSAVQTVAVLRAALVQVGAPADLLQCLTTSSREKTDLLMRSADLVVACGGPGTVRRAYASGTPAIAAGVGNATIIVDETADIASAAAAVILGGSYNCGTSCSSESNVLVHASVRDAFIGELEKQGGHVCTEAEATRLRSVLWPDGRMLERTAIGRSAESLAQKAHIAIAGPSTRALVVPRPRLEGGDPFLGEKLSPVVSVLGFETFSEAVATVDVLNERCGRGHSCGIHSSRMDRVMELAMRVRVSRVMVNQSTALGNSGSFENGLPFTSVIASGSWGGCSHSGNVTWEHFVNHTYVSQPIPAVVPDEEVLFGAHWAKYGH